MPLSASSSFVQALRFIKSHWISTNATLPVANPLMIPPNYTVNQFDIQIEQLNVAIIAIEDADTALELTVFELKQQQEPLQRWAPQFNRMVRALYAGTMYAQSLPLTPNVTYSESKYLNPLLEMNRLWMQIDALGTPLVLPGGVTRLMWSDQLQLLMEAYADYNDARAMASQLRRSRDLLLPNLRERMVQYRKMVVARFGLDSTATKTLPRITPKPGSTPIAPVLSANWDDSAGFVVLTWTPSPSKAVNRYSIRVCKGKKWVAKASSVVETVDSDVNRVETTVGLTDSGDVAAYKVFALTPTGNEKGSLAVILTRPE